MAPYAAQNTVNLRGQQLYYEIHGTGEPLLLLHGFPGSSQDWKPSLDQWGPGFQLLLPDLRGHGRSGILRKPFRHDEAAEDILALLDHLEVAAVNAVGISGGGNVLVHIATKRPERAKAVVLVSATPYFPPQARVIMREYGRNLPPPEREHLRRIHPGGDAQIDALLASTTAFADSYDDLNFTSAVLSTIRARTLIVQGNHDPLCPVEIRQEMAHWIPNSRLWIIPGGHGPVIGEKWPEFVKVARKFLSETQPGRLDDSEAH